MVKKCFKCKRSKSLHLFYKHSRMKDGHLNKCFACTKKDVKNRYYAKPCKVKNYERIRAQNPERKKKALEYQRKRRAKFPGKTRARYLVSFAVKKGLLTRLPCVYCGSPKSQAHHHDYRKPLEVTWVCFEHHRKHEHGQLNA